MALRRPNWKLAFKLALTEPFRPIDESSNESPRFTLMRELHSSCFEAADCFGPASPYIATINTTFQIIVYNIQTMQEVISADLKAIIPISSDETAVVRSISIASDNPALVCVAMNGKGYSIINLITQSVEINFMTAEDPSMTVKMAYMSHNYAVAFYEGEPVSTASSRRKSSWSVFYRHVSSGASPEWHMIVPYQSLRPSWRFNGGGHPLALIPTDDGNVILYIHIWDVDGSHEDNVFFPAYLLSPQGLTNDREEIARIPKSAMNFHVRRNKLLSIVESKVTYDNDTYSSSEKPTWTRSLSTVDPRTARATVLAQESHETANFVSQDLWANSINMYICEEDPSDIYADDFTQSAIQIRLRRCRSGSTSSSMTPEVSSKYIYDIAGDIWFKGPSRVVLMQRVVNSVASLIGITLREYLLW
jgi:hypothetical protein